MRATGAFIVLVLLVCSCVLPPVPVRLYGISGPYEGNILVGQVHRTGRNAGWIEITLPDGEHCSGEYAVVQKGSVALTSGSWHGLYQTVYGNQYTSMVQRSGEGMGTAIGNKGTVLEVNFFADTFSGHGFGVAKDNKGNLYKVHISDSSKPLVGR